MVGGYDNNKEKCVVKTADATYLPLRTVNGILRSYENNSQTGSIVLPWLGLSSEGAPLENVY